LKRNGLKLENDSLYCFWDNIWICSNYDTNWGERRDYRTITLEEMNRGKHFKLRYSHVHKLLRLRFGVIQEYISSTDSWNDTLFEINPEAYCVKIY
jgi:hypothetical protein